jgi:hypothetical protein
MRLWWIGALHVIGLAAGSVVLGCDGLSLRVESRNDLDGDPEACGGDTKTTHVAWDAESELGTPAQAFQAIEGRCEASLRWTAQSDLAPELDPSRTASMHVEVQLDHDSVRLLERTATSESCASELDVDATVTLRSDDGNIDATAKTKLRYRPDVPATLGFSLTNDEHHGALSLRERQGESAMLRFVLDGAGMNCAGDITVSNSSMSADGTGRGVAGRIGSWSASGCPTGQAPFDVAREVAGGTLPELIERAWDGRSLEGTWSDGAQTTLSLQVSPLMAASCSEPRAGFDVVSLPVEVRYGTDDGRLEARVTKASVRAELARDGEALHSLSLWISDELTCETSDSRLSYTQASCTQLKAATVQLNLSSAGDDTSLNVYFIPRFGEQPKPDTLSLR